MAVDKKQDKNEGLLRLESDQHPIRARDYDRDVHVILRTLNDAGFESYLVGGAVRDLWLGRTPKDFDIATMADTDTIRKLFRWSRTIGKRFPIVHVYRKPRKVFEVSTFREAGEDVYGEVRVGSPVEDARRRDVTVNALMLDVASNQILDWVGGIEDLKAERIHMIGDPVARFEEDPVRIIRCYRLANRIGFKIDADIYAAEAQRFRLLSEVPPGRLRLEKEKDFLGELSSGIMKSYRDAPFGMAVDEKLIHILQKVPDTGFELYDRLAAVLTANALWEDHKGLVRISLLGALMLPDLMGRVDEKKKYSMDQVAKRVEPLLQVLEVPRWKRPLIVQGIYGQTFLDEQIKSGFSKKMKRKTWFAIAMQIGRLRYALQDDGAEVVARLSQNLGHAEEQSGRPRRHPRRRPTQRRKRDGND